MNPKTIEESDARQVIGKAEELVSTGISGGSRDERDREAATLAVLVSAAQGYANRIGISWKRLKREVSDK